MNELGRNDLCWCGSGKKYKKCHMRADEAGKSAPPQQRRLAPSPLQLDEEGREGMRRAGKFNAQVMDFIRDHVRAGIRTDALDQLVHDYTLEHGAIPATLGYNGYPKSCCISRNEIVCHGIPNDAELRDGDIVNIDLTSIVDGWYGDQSETFLVGAVDEKARALVEATFESMWLGIDAAKPAGRVVEIGRAISKFAHEKGYSVVRDYQGHGIGRVFHQEPGIPHFPDYELGQFVLLPGICFTVEPMINVGDYRTELDRKDGWTVYTKDRSLSAQFEHTVLMTEDGPEILTLTERGPRRGHDFRGGADA
ncbi:MAG: type I methionyl aminopeptidase [Deltaproteobacteria bacterium]|nr:type I methionyl aminopeptidase [Deltaproteobacteria bacterium]